jgi:carbonic anhydrase
MAQTPIDIKADDITPRSDYTTDDYTFAGGDCTFADLKYGVLDNGVKIYYDSSKCNPPAVTIPDDPNLLTLGLGLNLGATLGTEVFGPEAGKTYTAAQFHIHSSSEHLLDGTAAEAELHIVHLQNGSGFDTIDELIAGLPLGLGGLLDDGSRAASVVGMFIARDGRNENEAFENLLKGLEAVGCGVKEGAVGASVTTSDPFSPYDFVPSESCYINYDGGLTTPTCDEIVEWNLATTPMKISNGQMNRLLNLINNCPKSNSWNGSTSRPVQPRNGRTLNEICPARRNLRASEGSN